jgi:glycerol-3-phosphate acyltransferase PlsX
LSATPNALPKLAVGEKSRTYSGETTFPDACAVEFQEKMNKPVRIALDAMGGDFGPEVVVAGAARALERRPDSTFLFFGNEAAVRPLLNTHAKLAARSTLEHTAVAIKMDDKPTQALRTGRRTSSMWMALEAVKTGEADLAVSAGNTGALMAMAKICLRTMAQIDRPALAAIWPTIRGESIVLDVGATIGADAQHLVDLAVMGAAMAHILFDLERPTVGLLNVGVEEIKGLEEVKAASRMLRDADLPALSYVGFVEGDDIGKGTVDVVVTEGFAGNIALKSAEGTAKQVAQYFRDAMNRSLTAKIGYFFARRAFDALRDKMDPRHSNGGVFLGLDGVVIKSHGGTDALGYAGAIEIGYEMVRHRLLDRIRDTLILAQDERTPPPSLPASNRALGSD